MIRHWVSNVAIVALLLLFFVIWPLSIPLHIASFWMVLAAVVPVVLLLIMD